VVVGGLGGGGAGRPTNARAKSCGNTCYHGSPTPCSSLCVLNGDRLDGLFVRQDLRQRRVVLGELVGDAHLGGGGGGGWAPGCGGGQGGGPRMQARHVRTLAWPDGIGRCCACCMCCTCYGLRLRTCVQMPGAWRIGNAWHGMAREAVAISVAAFLLSSFALQSICNGDAAMAPQVAAVSLEQRRVWLCGWLLVGGDLARRSGAEEAEEVGAAGRVEPARRVAERRGPGRGGTGAGCGW
jgi:hypothetical protein